VDYGRAGGIGLRRIEKSYRESSPEQQLSSKQQLNFKATGFGIKGMGFSPYIDTSASTGLQPPEECFSSKMSHE
jgi:hypothetical protein